MKISSFFKLVEIQTKVASIIPFLFGTFYTLYRYHSFSVSNAIIMFLSMIIFDMTVTAINNYMDHIKAIKKEGYGYEEHNAIVRDQLPLKHVRLTIFVMLLLSIILGILLVYKTDLIVLLLGIFCFVVGILYSYGPLPISRTPLGEICSGMTMGFMITFLSVYIHIFDQQMINLYINASHFEIFMNLSMVLSLFMVSLPLVTSIANIMLANNICDIEEDLENKRYTLPIYIGKENARLLFFALYIIAYCSIIFGILLHELPLLSLLTLLTLKPVLGNIKIFCNNPSKKDTFILSIKNFILINVVFISSIIVSLFFK